jgi:hypothetical protein
LTARNDRHRLVTATNEGRLLMLGRTRLTYANVTATIALFIALGGGAYAAFNLPRNSVESKHIANGQVKAPDVADLKFKPVTLVNGWTAVGDPYNEPGYAIDAERVVHLRGALDGSLQTSPEAFDLPPNARPASYQRVAISGTATSALVLPDGQVRINGADITAPSLDGAAFPAK